MAPLGFGLWRLSRAGTGEPGGGSGMGRLGPRRGLLPFCVAKVETFFVLCKLFWCFLRFFFVLSAFLGRNRVIWCVLRVVLGGCLVFLAHQNAAAGAAAWLLKEGQRGSGWCVMGRRMFRGP